MSEIDKTTSLIRLANSMSCDPKQVKEKFLENIIEKNLTDEEFRMVIQIFNEKKIEESANYNIKPEDTSSAFMEEWANEYFENIGKSRMDSKSFPESSKLFLIAKSGIFELEKTYKELPDNGHFEVLLFNSMLILKIYKNANPVKYSDFEREIFILIKNQTKLYSIDFDSEQLSSLINSRLTFYAQEYELLFEGYGYLPGKIYTAFYESPLINNPVHNYNIFELTHFLQGLTIMINWIKENSNIYLTEKGIKKNNELIFSTGTDSDGNIFKTVIIGGKEWMAENLNVSHFRNGDVIPEVNSDEDWLSVGDQEKPACCYFNNNTDFGKTFGKLYNWFTINDPRGLAPLGWHIPTDDEWTLMIENLGGEMEAGIKMKSKRGWNHEYENHNGSNSSGFSAIPCGLRIWQFDNDYIALVEWWTSSEDELQHAWIRSVSESNKVRRNLCSKRHGIYVRCIKD